MLDLDVCQAQTEMWDDREDSETGSPETTFLIDHNRSAIDSTHVSPHMSLVYKLIHSFDTPFRVRERPLAPIEHGADDRQTV
jgi:hypothetical protein